jgi:hypothetical protein
MVEFGGSVAMPLFPRHGLKPHWVATVQISSRRPGPLSLLLLPPVAAPVMFIPNPSLRYVLVAVDWLLDVTLLLQVMFRSLHVVP